MKFLAGVNISIYPVTGMTGLFLWSCAKIFILVFFVQKYLFCCVSCKNIHLDSFRPKILVFILFMIQTCSHQLVRATCIKRHLCAVLQKYSQGMAEKGVLKLSCRNILKKWQENVVLGTGPPWRNITLGGAEIFTSK